MAYVDRTRADGFGAAAELYDTIRPTYPAALIADLTVADPHRIIDVGCGTGKVARLLVAPGRQVLGLEPDARMAALATGYGIEVEGASLETWDAAGRRFDLLTAGQAWHWVDPVAGAVKAAGVLEPGGRFAAFWNRMEHRPEVVAACDDIYNRHAPHLLAGSIAIGAETSMAKRVNPAADGLRAAGFVDVETTSPAAYRRDVAYRPDEWVELLSTHSDHRVLEPARREALLDELRARLEQFGPTFDVQLRTDLLTATNAALD